MSLPLENALFAFLTGNAAVAALVGTRVYPAPFPEDATMPLIAYHGVSGVPDYPLAGAAFDRTTTFQVNAFGTDQPTARQVADAVVTAVEAWAPATGSGVTVADAWVANDIELYDPDPLVWQIAVDVAILWH